MTWSARLAGLVVVALLAALWPLLQQTWATPDERRIWGAFLVVSAYLAFCLCVYLRRRAIAHAEVAPAPVGQVQTLVAFASQTGFAEQLAWQTAEALQAAGMPIRVVSLAKLGAQDLQAAQRALFVVSTTGEGDAPDTAAGFARKVMGDKLGLDGLSYGVLALGDSSYSHYCAFGHALENWLHRQGAQPLFDTVQVDDGDVDALRHWQQYLGVLGGNSEMPDWTTPAYRRWRLAERLHLNPDSPGGAAFHLGLVPVDDMPDWQAGDIAEVGPRNAPAYVDAVLERLGLDGAETLLIDGVPVVFSEALSSRLLPHDAAGLQTLSGLSAAEVHEVLVPLPHREYSIASLPADGSLQLLVRQTHYEDGRLGLGSGWLTRHAELGAEIALRIRTNRGFHAPDSDRPLILIGNGTGLAGLRAHLKERVRSGRHRNWLLFGERTSSHDFFHRAEIENWHRSGVLTRLDLAFSRESGGCTYVQDCIVQEHDALRSWVADGAAIYVCGSLQGMAAGVAAALTDILGAEVLERMAEDGSYRRDVY